jgi:predicted O-methyltransferase YrrM
MILEIGTALGYSAAMMAEAAPTAHITTLNPKEIEYPRAVKWLAPYTNVHVAKIKSWDFLEAARHFSTPTYQWQVDMIFVDGDHGQIKRDLPWWEFLKVGGLMLFHDYSPEGSARPCQPVYDAVNDFAVGLGREPDLLVDWGIEPDLLVIDDRGVGLAGFYKREGE